MAVKQWRVGERVLKVRTNRQQSSFKESNAQPPEKLRKGGSARGQKHSLLSKTVSSRNQAVSKKAKGMEKKAEKTRERERCVGALLLCLKLCRENGNQNILSPLLLDRKRSPATSRSSRVSTD